MADKQHHAFLADEGDHIKHGSVVRKKQPSLFASFAISINTVLVTFEGKETQRCMGVVATVPHKHTATTTPSHVLIFTRSHEQDCAV
jgi:hypothetical protein